MTAANLTADRLRELLSYDPNTGVFIRKVRTAKMTQIGDIAGSKNKAGYIQICLEGSRFLGHRLAWFYVHGEWPKDYIDHINGDRSDNRICNLRDASPTVNAQNLQCAKPISKTGLLGASYCKITRKFKAQIRINGKQKYIGVYASAEEAHAAYIDFKRLHHPGCSI